MFVRRIGKIAVSSLLACVGWSGPEAAAQQYDWLVVSSMEMTPTIISKSGLGTSNAVAEARVTRQTVEGWCAGQRAGADVAKCVREQLASEDVKKTYRAAADCTRGQITTTDGQSYVFAGIWDRSDIGGGRTKWRDSSGNVVGRDNATGGLGISQQWEVLCPGPVRIAGSAGAARAAPAGRPAQAAARPPAAPEASPLCPGMNTPCTEVASFAATIADFRTSVSGRYRLVTATMRFTNKTPAPLILGYVHNSGIVTDDQGNRYALNGANGLRGMGLIAGNSVDPKFALQAGQSSDARFEFIWQPGREIIGLQFEVDLAIREIAPIPSNPNQFRLGMEHALHFSGLGNTQITAAPAPAAAPGQVVSGTPAPAPAAVSVEVNPCGDAPRCYSAGLFTAEVGPMTGSIVGGRHHVISLNIRFKNVSDQPIVLAYKAGSSVLIDDLGNRYGWGRPGTHDTSVTGIGISQANRADPQFVLNPGQSRSATFNVIRHEAARKQLGTSFTYDVTIEQLEILSSRQIRTIRDHSLNFPDLSMRASARETGGKLLDLLKGKKSQP